MGAGRVAEMIDLERLQLDKTFRHGKTTDMLIAAIQNTDFSPGPVTIWMRTHSEAKLCILDIIGLAEEMGYPVSDRRPFDVKVNGVTITARSGWATPKLRQLAEQVHFIDHSLTEQDQ